MILQNSNLQHPICLFSHQNINKICLYPHCNSYPFICRYCQNLECQNPHIHQGKLQTSTWSSIQKLIIQALDIRKLKNVQWMTKKYNEQINEIIEQLKKLENVYLRRVQQINEQMMLNDNFEKILLKIKDSKFTEIKGMNMRAIYQKLRMDNYVENKQYILKKKSQQSQSFMSTLKNIKSQIKSYQNKHIYELIDSPHKSTQQILTYHPSINHQNNHHLYFQKALTHLQHNHNQQALNYFHLAIQFDNTNPNYYYHRGITFLNKKQYQQSYKDLTKAVQLCPNMAKAYYNLGKINQQKNQIQIALQNYSKAIQLNPKIAAAYNQRGQIYHLRNDFQKAFFDFSKAIQYNSKFYNAYYNRGKLYDEFNEIEKAIQDYSRGIQNKENYAQCYLNRGILYNYINQVQKAHKDFNKALQYDENNAQIHGIVGDFYLSKSDYLALSQYNKMIQLDKNTRSGYKKRSIIYRKLNRLLKAQCDQKKHQQIMDLLR